MPKLHSYKQYPYTAKVYSFRIRTGPTVEESIYEYYYLRDITLDVIQDDFGRVLCLFRDSEADLKPQVQLNELKAKDGTELFPSGIWTLNTFEPNITSMNTREGFRGRADLTHEDGT